MGNKSFIKYIIFAITNIKNIGKYTQKQNNDILSILVERLEISHVAKGPG